MLHINQDLAGASDPRNGTEFLRFGSGPSGTERVLKTGIASALFIPIRWENEIRHVLMVGWNVRRELGADTIETAQLLADQAAAGYARLEADARRAAGSNQDRAVVRAARALNASLDLQEILLTLVHEAALALDAETSGVYLAHHDEH